MDRVEYIKELQQKEFHTSKKQSVIVNNMFSLISIIIISIATILYVNSVVPAQKAKAKRELKAKQHQEYLDKRERQIALSHKLNK